MSMKHFGSENTKSIGKPCKRHGSDCDRSQKNAKSLLLVDRQCPVAGGALELVQGNVGLSREVLVHDKKKA